MHDCWWRRCESVSSLRQKLPFVTEKNMELPDLVVFRLANLTESSLYGNRTDDDPNVLAIKKKFASVFRDDLPPGLPPKRNIDHAIETNTHSKPQINPSSNFLRPNYKQPNNTSPNFYERNKLASVNCRPGSLSFSSSKKVNFEESWTTVRLFE